MAAIRTRYGKLCVDFRYLNIRCRETTALEDNAQNRKKLEKRLSEWKQKSYWVFLTMLNTFQKVLV